MDKIILFAMSCIISLRKEQTQWQNKNQMNAISNDIPTTNGKRKGRK